MTVSLRKPVVYRPGAVFRCWERTMANVQGGSGPECAAEIRIHGYWWCAQICPKCLANYWASGASRMTLRLDTAGFFTSDSEALVRRIIAENGGQYVPRF